MPLLPEQMECEVLFHVDIILYHNTGTKPTDKCRAAQFQTLLPHTRSNSEKINGRLNLNQNFLELEFILIAL